MSAEPGSLPSFRVAPEGLFSFLADPDIRSLTDAFEARRADSFRFVGGCVRNPLIDLPASDLDAATLFPPETTIEIIKEAGWKPIPTGIDHGTVTAVKDGRPVEITTVRADVETDGRHAIVRFGTDWTTDWRRRDFTMNALYLTPAGDVYDPASGAEDAKARRVRFIGDPDARISEDYLRILRFYRFSAWYAAEIDAAGDEACARGAGGLADLSAERVRMELLKLLAAPQPTHAARAMSAAGVLQARFGVGGDIASFERLVRLTETVTAAGRPVVRLAALISAADARFADGLRLSNLEKAELLAAQASAATLTDLAELSDPEIRAARYRLGAEGFAAGGALAWARSGADTSDERWRRALRRGLDWTPLEFSLSGDDVKRAGVAPGPAVGRVLRAVEGDWIEADFPDDPAFIQARLTARAAEEA